MAKRNLGKQFSDGNFAWKIRFSGTRLASL
jgi:hypothetical protein